MARRGIHWCPNCNSPLLSEKCDRCEESGIFLPLSRAADARPAFVNDIKLIEELLSKEYGNRIVSALRLKNQFLLLNRLPYLDKAYEIIMNGEILAHVFFDIFSLKWKIKPFRALLRFMEQTGIEFPHAVLNKEKINKHELLDRDNFQDVNFNEKTEYLGLYSKRNEIIGLGQRVNGKILVLKIWKRKSSKDFYPKGKTSRKDVLAANKWQIEILTSRACKFLSKTADRFNRKVFVSYSGGKDSLTCLLLSLKAGIDPSLLFVDTCLEMPETIQNVREVTRSFQLDVYIAKADIEKFWKRFYAVGPPARDFRWCSRLCKLEPTNRALASLGNTLCIVGQRRVESLKRATAHNIWKNPYVKGSINVTPISDWKALHIWLFMINEKAEKMMNELYLKGFDRVGCYMCPSATIADMQKVKEWHPELWRNWEKALEEWKNRNFLEDSWLKYALWRWRKRIPKALKAFLEGKSE